MLVNPIPVVGKVLAILCRLLHTFNVCLSVEVTIIIKGCSLVAILCLIAFSISSCNEIGGIYRLASGVTSRINEQLKWSSHKNAYSIVKELYNETFDKQDLLFVKFILAGDQFKIKSNLINWLIVLYYFIRNINNFSYNNPAFRNLHYLLPLKVNANVKLILYPFLIGIRPKLYGSKK